MSAKVVLDGRAEFAVVFGPDGALPPGDELSPGGWKGPAHLDADFDTEARLP